LRSFGFILTIFAISFFMLSLNAVGEDEDPTTLAPVWSYTKEDSEGTFWKLAWSPDGELIAATFFDNTCIILNSEDGSVVKTIDMSEFITRCDGFAPDGTRPLRAVSFSPDGNYLATGGDELVVRIFDTENWELKRSFIGHTGSILCMEFSPDSRYLATGSGTDKVIPQNDGENLTRIWDLETGRETLVLQGHRDGVLSVSWSQDGGRIATVSDDRTLRIWTFPEGEEIKQMKGHTSGVLDVSWTPDETRLITGSRDYKIKVWDYETGEELGTWSDYNCVRSVDVHPNGAIAATSGVDLTLKIRDMETGTELKVIKDGMEQKAMVMSSRWSPDGNSLASGLGKSHTVILYEFGRGSGASENDDLGMIILVTGLILVGLIGTALIFYPAIREIRGRRD
jgi:WD40 repeat protein